MKIAELNQIVLLHRENKHFISVSRNAENKFTASRKTESVDICVKKADSELFQQFALSDRKEFYSRAFDWRSGQKLPIRAHGHLVDRWKVRFDHRQKLFGIDVKNSQTAFVDLITDDQITFFLFGCCHQDYLV